MQNPRRWTSKWRSRRLSKLVHCGIWAMDTGLHFSAAWSGGTSCAGADCAGRPAVELNAGGASSGSGRVRPSSPREEAPKRDEHAEGDGSPSKRIRTEPAEVEMAEMAGGMKRQLQVEVEDGPGTPVLPSDSVS